MVEHFGRIRFPVGTEFKIGDAKFRVKEVGSGPACTSLVESSSGYNHYLFLESRQAITDLAIHSIVLPEPEYITGEAYEDKDGEKFIRASSTSGEEGWYGVDGFKSDNYPARPLKKL